MRNWINIITEMTQQGVPIDMLPREAKMDILDMLLGPNGPKDFEEYWMKENGIMSFTEAYVSQFLFGEENLDVAGGYDGDTILVNLFDLDPQELDNSNRGVSTNVVGQYAAMTTKAPPILVRKMSNGWQLVEGGHRLAAAKTRGDTNIQAIDVTIFFSMTIENWKEL